MNAYIHNKSIYRHPRSQRDGWPHHPCTNGELEQHGIHTVRETSGCTTLVLTVSLVTLFLDLSNATSCCSCQTARLVLAKRRILFLPNWASLRPCVVCPTPCGVRLITSQNINFLIDLDRNLYLGFLYWKKVAQKLTQDVGSKSTQGTVSFNKSNWHFYCRNTSYTCVRM